MRSAGRPVADRGGWERTWLILILAGCLATLAGAPLPLLDGDAALYGTIAKNILATGEWLTLQYPSRPGWIVDKPPLTFWLMAISLRAGGTTAPALRFWQLLMSVALVLVVYRFARLAAGSEESLLAALLLVTFQQVFYSSMTPQQDVPLALFLALAFYAYLGYRRSGRTGAAALAGVWVALVVLTRGIVWLAVFGLIVGADLLVAWRWARGTAHWSWSQVGVGAAVCAVVASPWFIIGAIRQGMPFVETFLLGENGIQRFLRPFLSTGSVVPTRAFLPLLLVYVPMLMLGMLPWTGLLPGAVREAWRSLRAGPPSLRLCALWLVLFFLLLSFSRGDKVIRYLLSCYPPLAVLAARFLNMAIDDPRRMRTAAGISLLLGIPVMLAALWLSAGHAPHESRFYLPIIMPSIFVFSLAVTVFAVVTLWGRGRQAVAVLAAGALLSYGLTYWMIMRQWEQLWPWRTVAATVNRLYRPGDRVLVPGSVGAETQFASYWIEALVEPVADEAVFTRAWQEVRVFGLLSPEVHSRLRDRLRPNVLVSMPLGWVLVTNR